MIKYSKVIFTKNNVQHIFQIFQTLSYIYVDCVSHIFLTDDVFKHLCNVQVLYSHLCGIVYFVQWVLC